MGIGVSLLILNFFLGHFFLENYQLNLSERIVANLKTLVWYLTLFVYISSFTLLPREFIKKNINHFIKNLDFIVYLQILTVVIGLFTDIYLFQSYGKSRFGYSGIFINVMQGNYLYILLIIIYFYKLLLDNSVKNRFNLLLLLIFSSLIGTKGILLFNTIFLNYLAFQYLKKESLLKYFYPFLFILIIGFIGGIIFIINSPILQKIYKEEGFLNLMTSMRYSLVTDSFFPFINNYWTNYNYLFGGAMFNLNRTEFEVIDFLWFFGIVGSVIYFTLINKYLVKIKYLFTNIPFISLGFIILLTGSFFSSITTTLLFVFLILFLLENNLLPHNEYS
ncbi:hypothetical protein [Faecalibacter sp. LW9]|uniref:hypothetical protein n=1 Tax=Faecalibacter sp. LW9 TaxID=3103144 RepID=UPI002AFFAAEA|nr:hypothetical protein [Faecalibacter sp. LW9]